eukprot:g733.t1
MSRLGELSEYEKRRIERIKRNEAMLAKLGLAPKRFTVMAVGKKAPLPRRVKRRVITGPTRRSLRLAGKPMPNYKEERIEEEKKSASSEKTSPPPLKRAKRATARQIAMAAQKRVEEVPKQRSRMSIKYLNVDVERLHSSWLGKIVPKLGGQVKRAVMELAVSNGSPKFSRMSGIQEWRNVVMLFVNVYGDEYKNVFLHGGRQITWFAQSRQWEGTPVIQRLIHCAGGCVSFEDEEEDVNFEETPVLLFCRNLGQGYVYCGELSYMAHEPSQIPVRFVWCLDDFEYLQKNSKPFRSLVEACHSLVGVGGDGE